MVNNLFRVFKNNRIKKDISLFGVSILVLTSAICGCGNKKEEMLDSQGRTRLELAVVGEDYNLSELILEFNKTQKDFYIETVEYNRLDITEADEDLSVQLDDGIAKLQREIVSGKGPDIIDYGESFTTSDICGEYTEDLRDYFIKEYGSIDEGFYENVFDAFSYKGKLYCVPTSFFIETLVGKKKNLDGMDSWNLDQMLESISKKKGMSLWPNASQMDVFSEVLTANMEQYIDWENGKALFDSESFRKLLEYSKELPTSPGEKVTYKEFGEDKVLLYNVNTGSEFEVTKIRTLFGKDDLSFIGYPSDNNEGTKVQTGATVLGISSASKNKDGAFEFIKFVLSENVQKKVMDGFSVNRKVVNDLIQNAQIQEYATDSDGEKGLCIKDTVELSDDEIIDIYNISEEDALETEELLSGKLYSCNIDWNLYFVILDEANEYFDNKQDIDKTIENIQSRVSIYVAEKGM